MADTVRVEIVFAEERSAFRRQVMLPEGATVAEAVVAAGVASALGDAFDPARLGIFSRPVTLDHVVVDGDRIELYRPLRLDPKEARRRRAR